MTKLLSLDSGHRRQFLLRSRRPIHAARTARTGPGQSENSGRRWLRTWLSPWPIWRLPSQRLLRGSLLGRRCGGARRGGSARRGCGRVAVTRTDAGMFANQAE